MMIPRYEANAATVEGLGALSWVILVCYMLTHFVLLAPSGALCLSMLVLPVVVPTFGGFHSVQREVSVIIDRYKSPFKIYEGIDYFCINSVMP